MNPCLLYWLIMRLIFIIHLSSHDRDQFMVRFGSLTTMFFFTMQLLDPPCTYSRQRCLDSIWKLFWADGDGFHSRAFKVEVGSILLTFSFFYTILTLFRKDDNTHEIDIIQDVINATCTRWVLETLVSSLYPSNYLVCWNVLSPQVRRTGEIKPKKDHGSTSEVRRFMRVGGQLIKLFFLNSLR